MKGLHALFIIAIHFCESVVSIDKVQKSDDEKITFVQIKPLINKDIKIPNNSDTLRSSRIENIPLQIRGTPIHSHSVNKPHDKKAPSSEIIRTPRSENRSIKLSDAESSTEISSRSTDYVDRDHESEIRFDTSEAIVPDLDDGEDFSVKTDLEDDKISTPQENDLYKYYPKNANIKSKIFPLKKYYGDIESINPTYRKYIETRRFRSRCRCERIWNCPKLQISVPRCPAEYFMCCF